MRIKKYARFWELEDFIKSVHCEGLLKVILKADGYQFNNKKVKERILKWWNHGGLVCYPFFEKKSFCLLVMLKNYIKKTNKYKWRKK